MIQELFFWIRVTVSIIGVTLLILLGLMVIRDWTLQNFYDWKLSRYKQSFKYEAELLVVVHLKKLKKDFPELEISYKGKELQD